MVHNERTSEFKHCHPLVNFMYFLSVIGLSCVFMHPVCIAIALFSSLAYSIFLGGKKTIKYSLLYMLPSLVISTFFNAAFNHEGITILAYLPSGNPLTLEAIVYGIASTLMLIAVISWFSCFNKIVTSDKLMYVFGKITPALSLVFSMVLRFAPRFKARIKAVSDAQKSIGRDASGKNIIIRAKNGIKILSIMISWSLENAVETADSMKSRGYGLSDRTAFSNFTFSKRDIALLCAIFVLLGYILINAVLGQMKFYYYPQIIGEALTVRSVSVYLAYFLLCATPMIIECREAYKWKLLKSKI